MPSTCVYVEKKNFWNPLQARGAGVRRPRRLTVISTPESGESQRRTVRQHAVSCATVAGSSGPALLPPAPAERRRGGRREGALGGAAARMGELSDRDDYEVCPSAPICTGRRWCRHCSRRGTCGAAGGSPLATIFLNPSTRNPTLDAPSCVSARRGRWTGGAASAARAAACVCVFLWL